MAKEDDKAARDFQKKVAGTVKEGEDHAKALNLINETLVGWNVEPIKLKKAKRPSAVPSQVVEATKKALADKSLNISGWKRAVIEVAGYFDESKLADFRAALVAEGIIEVVKDAVGTGKTIRLIKEE